MTPALGKVGVGVIGSGFVADLHLAAFSRNSNATVLAVAGRSSEKAARLAAEYGIADSYGDYRSLLDRDDIDMVCVGTPNDTHRDIVLAAVEAGKHIVCEKPLARTLAEADEMIAAAHEAGVKLMYAELICFAPKYVRAKQLIDEGAFGRVFQIKHGEQHSGPHSDWFWQGERSGGGVMMDMGCHGVEVIRWMYDKPAAQSVTAELGTFMHANRTDLDDHALVTIRFEGNRLGAIETSWAKPGGMEDRIEIIGDGGVAYVDLLRGSSISAYSEAGYGYAVEKASQTSGWTFAMFEEYWNYGIPQEMQHFADCVLNDTEAIETGADGRADLEIIYAAYLSAGRGERVHLPLELSKEDAARSPYLLWREGASAAQDAAL